MTRVSVADFLFWSTANLTHCILVNKKKSVGALISTTNADLTRYYSTVCIHESNDELQVSMGQAFTRALEA